ncbi:WYL domain-containing protein [Paenibacillus sp. HGF7]|uniref:WYL domain-containing protein n=1 Tax=Paenibacillus sp. HGF7 TaxID=944559 RepID=UPI002016323D|nr:WYL domain-containing protein [Paenibacillus sp. HGF7]
MYPYHGALKHLDTLRGGRESGGDDPEAPDYPHGGAWRRGYPPSSWLAESILSFGDGVEVLEPGELIEDIRQRIEKMRNLYTEG